MVLKGEWGFRVQGLGFRGSPPRTWVMEKNSGPEAPKEHRIIAVVALCVGSGP